jgi:acyl-CoA thioester hydrolase
MSLEESQIEHLLKAFPVVIEIPVAWGEMDALRHVNNVVYFRYFESARIAYFEKLKLGNFMHENGIGFILGSTKCRFKAALTFPDRLLVGTRTSDVKEDRLVMQHCLVSRRLQKVAAESEAVLVSYDYRKAKKAPLPEEWRRYVQELEASKGDQPCSKTW